MAHEVNFYAIVQKEGELLAAHSQAT